MNRKDNRYQALASGTGTAAFREGAEHGLEDASRNRKLNLRPRLLKSVWSDRYREEYTRGYRSAYYRTLIKVREAALPQRHQRRKQSERER